MDRCQPVAEDFAGYEQVSEIGAGEARAGIAVATLIERARIVDESPVSEIDPASAGQDRSVPGDPSGQHTVEHVDAARNRLHEIRRRADPHQVARTLARQDCRLQRQEPIGGSLRFAQAQSADAEAVKRQLREDLRAFSAKLLVEPALNDPEAQLSGGRLTPEASAGPLMGPLHRGPPDTGRGRPRYRLVEGPCGARPD